MPIVVCPSCSMRVIAKPDGTCPSCRGDLADAAPYVPAPSAPSALETPESEADLKSPPPPVRRISKNAFFVLTLGVPGAGLVAFLSGVFRSDDVELGLLAAGVFLAAILCGYTVACATVYRLWAAVQEPSTRPSPGVATALFAIPVVNLVGVFVAIGGWAEKYNALEAPRREWESRHERPFPAVSAVPGVIYGLLHLLWLIPALTSILGPFLLVTYVVFWFMAIDAVNRLADLAEADSDPNRAVSPPAGS